jgi:hypothetical protein
MPFNELLSTRFANIGIFVNTEKQIVQKAAFRENGSSAFFPKWLRSYL